MTSKRRRWYIGYTGGPASARAFSSESEPTLETHGHMYSHCLGPFRTKRAAMYAEAHPYGARYYGDIEVSEYERVARESYDD